MKLRRCAIVFFEPRESVDFDLMSLFSGGAGLSRQIRWLALAPHLDDEVEVNQEEREILGSISPSDWINKKSFASQAIDLIDALLKKGLLVGDTKAHKAIRDRDDVVRSAYWWPAAAMLHKFCRWKDLDSVASMEANKLTTAPELRDKLGPPPPEVISKSHSAGDIELPRLAADEYEKLMATRATCRNFDQEKELPIDIFSRMMQRVVMAQAVVRLQEDTAFVKKNVPSAGGLHPTEVYLVVQRVEGIAPGLYHYHPVEHKLELLSIPSVCLATLATEMLAGQHWFAGAHVQLILAPRYARSFWKYRFHSKAYRAVTLDVGHISQAIYSSATQLGLGAFVTSAINDVNVENAFGLDPLLEGPLAICGFGWRSKSMTTTEFDPLNEVWLGR